VPLDALALALAAAVVHAAWNAGLAGAEQTRATTAVALLAGAALFAPAAALTWDVEAAALPYLAGSIVAEFAYVALLAAAYDRAEMSVVYPVARGAAPVMVLAGSVVALGARPGPLQIAGVGLVAAGVVLVRGIRRPTGSADLLLALAVAATIATYTVIDKRGLEHASPLPYLEIELLGAALLYTAWLAARGAGPELRAAAGPRAVLAGIGMYGGYGLVLAALERAPAAAVAAVRETSVLIGLAIAAVTLGERVTRARVLGSAAIVAGVAAIAV
jgi:drug/metabolite transporter (DMT)-like permease